MIRGTMNGVVAEELPLTGRRRETEAIESLLASAADGLGGGVLITGESGIGKSRLLAEAARLAANTGMIALTGRSVENGGAYRPLVSALSRAAACVADDPRLVTVRATLARILPTWALAPPRIVAPLADPVVVIGDAITVLLEVLNGRGCALLLDDVQWADQDTLAVLGYLVERAPEQRVALILAARKPPELPASLGRLVAARQVEEIRLSRLTTAQVRRLIEEAARIDLGQQVVMQMADAADGLPLVIDEMVRQVDEECDLSDVVRAIPGS